MSAEENKVIMRRYFSVFEEGNIDLLDELLAPDYTNHTPATPDLPTGPEGVKGVVSMFRGGMPDLRVVVEDMIAEGDKVATRYTLEGTHEGELFGIPPTGQRLSIKSFTVERVSDGKIRDHWRVSDNLDMMQQLGVVPGPRQEGVEPSSPGPSFCPYSSNCLEGVFLEGVLLPLKMLHLGLCTALRAVRTCLAKNKA